VPIPLLGVMAEFFSSPNTMIQRCHRDYGPVFTIPVRCVLVCRCVCVSCRVCHCVVVPHAHPLTHPMYLLGSLTILFTFPHCNRRYLFPPRSARRSVAHTHRCFTSA
jgi:hypothetical protein